MSKDVKEYTTQRPFIVVSHKAPQKPSEKWVRSKTFVCFLSAFLLPRKLSYKFLSKHVLHDKNLESKNRKWINKLNLTVQCIIYSIKTAWEPMREELCFQGKQLFIVSWCRLDSNAYILTWSPSLSLIFYFCHSVDNFTPLKLILLRF